MKFPGSNQTFMKLGGPWTPYWGKPPTILKSTSKNYPNDMCQITFFISNWFKRYGSGGGGGQLWYHRYKRHF